MAKLGADIKYELKVVSRQSVDEVAQIEKVYDVTLSTSLIKRSKHGFRSEGSIGSNEIKYW